MADASDWATHYVIRFLSDRLQMPEESIHLSDKLADFELDSLDFVELIMALEDEFQRKLPDATANGLATVGDLIELVRRWRG